MCNHFFYLLYTSAVLFVYWLLCINFRGIFLLSNSNFNLRFRDRFTPLKNMRQNLSYLAGICGPVKCVLKPPNAAHMKVIE